MSASELSVGAVVSVSDLNAASIHSTASVESASGAGDGALHLSPVAPPEATPIDRLTDRIQDLSGGPEKVGPAAEDGVSVLGADAAKSGSLADVGVPTATPPTYTELMQNFRSATSYAMEVNLVGSAGTSMAGSMSKLMSGN